MELTGDMRIAAPRDKVWDALNDPDILARCIPGCEGIEVISPSEKTARVMVKVGPVRARFTGHIRMGEVRPGEGCTLQFEGSGGAAGMAKGQSELELADQDGGTRLRYNVKASVAGKLGQVGGRMIDAAAQQMAGQFFAALNKQMGEPPLAGAAGEIATSEAPGEGKPGLSSAQSGAAAASLPAPAESASTLAIASHASTERLRVLWFVLGSLATGFGVWIGSLLNA